jgi:hypothetical protein
MNLMKIMDAVRRHGAKLSNDEILDKIRFSKDCVLVMIHRPEAYEDVDSELVAEDAIRNGWKYEVMK